ncbi:MAG: TIGR03936 family radical SAM-associated protein [Desulfobacterota bacterium]|nr:TIGR03936 family radical SAM-associated protein [Thermodesulfobacteriota bacterium]MDW8002120.1 TIGR03936 family radical SAM-associated protein [Deltaproteobacteria bacterium]
MATENHIPFSISKPARYLGIEKNAVFKDPRKVKLRVALCYPDIYEIGMSYYGYFLLYEFMNKFEDVWCERCFAPWADMGEYIGASTRKLVTLESKTPLFEMDVVGFSLTYELNFTNVLYMMELGGIEKFAEKREKGPIVLGGGPVMMNPCPYEPFFDLIVIGEGEAILTELLERLKELKGQNRYETLKELSRMEGVYSPLFPKTRVKRVYVKNLNDSFHPVRPPIPTVGSIHDRLNIEISRGCGNGCRFCLAGYVYRPYRERSLESLKGIIDQALKATGYEEVSFLSLSSGDHPELFELIRYIKECHPGVSVSLPSIRIGTLSQKEIELIGSISRTGFTFALETPSERLRSIINKDIDVEALHRQISLLKRCGWRHLKVYMMIGLPYETEEDLAELKIFLEPIIREGIDVHVALSPFIPKPHTPFQYFGMDDEKTLKEKVTFIKGILRTKNVKLKYRDIRQAMAEAIISRGDRRIADLFVYLREKNVKFEAWREFFDFQKYVEWFAMESLDMKSYLGGRKETDPLPWDFIDSGVERKFLLEEKERAKLGTMTVACQNSCSSCGISCIKRIKVKPKESKECLQSIPALESLGTTKITLRFGKLGRSRYIGHLDTVRCLIRAMRVSGLVFKYHGKYHPLPKISVSEAIPLGIESTCEYLTAEVMNLDYDLKRVLSDINLALPKGMKVFEIFRGDFPSQLPVTVLVVGKRDLNGKNLTPLKERNGKIFFLFEGRNLKELLRSEGLERVIKIREEKVRAFRTDHKCHVQ